MYRWLRNYFAFSPAETRGMFVLFLLMLLLWVSPLIYRPLLTSQYKQLTQDRRIADSLIRLIEASSATDLPVHELSPALAPFDPNIVDKATLLSMGVPPVAAASLVKYRERGGKFRVKKDVQKIYGLTEEIYLRLAPYITLPEVRQTTASSQKVKVVALDINKADTTQLMTLRGVGTVFSARIVKFRELLGGFYTTDQLKEVYGINELALENLQKHTYVAEGFVPVQLRINEANAKTLVRHPYISYELAIALLRHREAYGSFTDQSQLKEVPLFTDSIYHKLKPYIAID